LIFSLSGFSLALDNDLLPSFLLQPRFFFFLAENKLKNIFIPADYLKMVAVNAVHVFGIDE